jgi:hypothetical protein
MIFDISKNEEYQSQRDNIKRPRVSCNVTSTANALFASKVVWSWPDEVHPADYIMSELESEKTWEEFYKRFPYEKNHPTFSPWNSSDMLAWVTNEIVGYKVVDVRRATIEEILLHIIVTHCAVVVSGSFFKGGHFVCVVGLDTEQEINEICQDNQLDMTKIKGILIDDPYGDFRNFYKSTNGNNISMTVNEFMDIIYEEGKDNKKAQFFLKDGWDE